MDGSAGVDDYRQRFPEAPDWFLAALADPGTAGRVTVNGAGIAYRHWEARPGPGGRKPGPGVLLLHGRNAHLHWWSFLAPLLTAFGPVVAIDAAGAGDSDARAIYTEADAVAEVLAPAEACGLVRPVVVGHSFGGFVALLTARRLGAAASGLVIVDTVIQSEAMRAARRGRRRVLERRIYPDPETALRRFRLLPQQDCPNPWLVDFVGRRAIAPFAGGWSWKFDPAHVNSAAFREDFVDRLDDEVRALACPTALIYGERSGLFTPERLAAIAALVGPKTPMIGIPEAAHHIMMDQPLALLAALRTLLSGWQSAAEA